ncbi:hypothetical protein ACIF6L_34815 [Kitasatospora sp. NPDC086009]|uniref:hypothetical protein n=1 Tax=unclassified Kitasatospora TaxID=2633591 RepID=UPI0037C5E785
MYSVIVDRPGEYRDIRIGPIENDFTAETIAHHLRRRMATTAHVPGTTVRCAPYVQHTPHLHLVSDDPYQIAEWMDHQPEHDGDGEGAGFPSYEDRVEAEYPQAEGRLWAQALKAYNALFGAPVDDDPAPSELPPLAATWTDLPTYNRDPQRPTTVHLTLSDGRRAELHLDDEQREALGLALVDPSLPEDDTDSSHLRRPTPRRRIRIRVRVR